MYEDEGLENHALGFFDLSKLAEAELDQKFTHDEFITSIIDDIRSDNDKTRAGARKELWALKKDLARLNGVGTSVQQSKQTTQADGTVVKQVVSTKTLTSKMKGRIANVKPAQPSPHRVIAARSISDADGIDLQSDSTVVGRNDPEVGSPSSSRPADSGHLPVPSGQPSPLPESPPAVNPEPPKRVDEVHRDDSKEHGSDGLSW